MKFPSPHDVSWFRRIEAEEKDQEVDIISITGTRGRPKEKPRSKSRPLEGPVRRDEGPQGTALRLKARDRCCSASGQRHRSPYRRRRPLINEGTGHQA